jgi:hypothetical protein
VGAYPHFRQRFAGKQRLGAGRKKILVTDLLSIVSRARETFHGFDVGEDLTRAHCAERVTREPMITMIKDAAYWIEKLGLERHPEGGYYRQSYKADLILAKGSLPPEFTGPRAASTAIYFLLDGENFSAFHRLRSDELWHFYVGATLVVHVIEEGGRYSEILLGNDPEAGEVLQAVVKAGCWFASRLRDGESFALVGCTVAPGFEFADFEMAKREKLVREYPQHRGVIEGLTRE